MIPISQAWPPLKAYWKHIFIEEKVGERQKTEDITRAGKMSSIS